jgi:hypothetical protein
MIVNFVNNIVKQSLARKSEIRTAASYNNALLSYPLAFGIERSIENKFMVYLWYLFSCHITITNSFLHRTINPEY